MKIVGKVLWWDRKDLNGIIVDARGNEFYFDISVVDGRKTQHLKRGTIVQFQLNSSIKGIPCAQSVLVPPAKSKGRLEKEFQRDLQLAFQF
jgi:cold shock CspA family protein